MNGLEQICNMLLIIVPVEKRTTPALSAWLYAVKLFGHNLQFG